MIQEKLQTKNSTTGSGTQRGSSPRARIAVKRNERERDDENYHTQK